MIGSYAFLPRLTVIDDVLTIFLFQDILQKIYFRLHKFCVTSENSS